MARLVVAAAGAVVGYIASGYNPAGAQYGWAIGMAVGGAFEKPNRVQGPKIEDLRVTGVEYGQAIPWVAGRPIVPGQIWWASDRRAVATTTEQGGKGGPGTEYTTYTYEVDLLIGLTEIPIAGVSRVWTQGRLDYNVLPTASSTSRAASAAGLRWRRFTVYTGDAAQLPDPTYEAAVGAGNAPAYRGRGSVFIEGLQLGSSGQIPNLNFEVFTAGTPGGTGYNDNFNDGINPYSQITGSPSFSTLTADYGVAIKGAGRVQVGVADEIRRTVPSSLADGVRVKFRLGDLAGDDAQVLALLNSGTIVFAFNPRREAAFDALQRPVVTISGTANSIGSAALDAYQWHQLDVQINAGANASTATITNLETGATVISTTLTGTFTPLTINQQSFINDSTIGLITTTETDYSDLQVIAARASVTDATVQAAVEALCLRSGLAAGQFDASGLSSITQPMRGLAVTQVGATRTTLEALQAAYFFDAVLSDKLYFRRRGGSSVATIPWADLGASNNADGDPEPLALKPGSELELPAGVAVRYMNADADAATDIQQADRLVSASRTVSTVELPLLLTAAEAKAVADVMLLDMQAKALASTRIKVLASYARLEPADVITVTAEDGSTFRVFIGQKNDSQGVLALDCVLDDASVLTQAGVTSTDYVPSSNVSLPADTVLRLMDMPILRDADNDPGYYAAAKGSQTPWAGAAAFTSADDITYSQAATITEAAVIGTASTALANWAGGNVFDEVSSVTVAIGSGTLSSATRDAVLDQQANAALLGSEVIQFRTATLVSAGVYTLTGLLRGRRGTEWAMGTHVVAERFVMLSTTGLRRLPVTTAEIGALRYVKGVTLGRTLGTAAAQTITPAAVGLKPFSPVVLRTSRDVVSDIALLLHCNGTNGSGSFPDSSLFARTINSNGNAQIQIADKKYGSGSGLFDGSGDYLAAVTASDWTFLHDGTAWTVECWVKLGATGRKHDIFSTAFNTAHQGIYIGITTTGAVLVQVYRGASPLVINDTISGVTITDTTTWHHLAVTFFRSGSTNTAEVYIDGVSSGTGTSTQTPGSSAPHDALQIGRFADPTTSALQGALDDIRITRGSRVYTAGFTPPAAEFADPSSGAGDITFTWSRRTRLAENFNSSLHPLGEASEAYEVEVYSDGTFTTLKRTITGLTTASATYTAVQQTADFGSVQSSVNVRVYQISATVGRGYALQGTI